MVWSDEAEYFREQAVEQEVALTRSATPLAASLHAVLAAHYRCQIDLTAARLAARPETLSGTR